MLQTSKDVFVEKQKACDSIPDHGVLKISVHSRIPDHRVVEVSKGILFSRKQTPARGRTLDHGMVELVKRYLS